MTDNIRDFLVDQVIRTVFRYHGGSVKLADIPAAVEAAFQRSGLPRVKTEDEVLALLGAPPTETQAGKEPEPAPFPLAITPEPKEPAQQATAPGAEPVVGVPLSAFMKLVQEAAEFEDSASQKPELLDGLDWQLLSSAKNPEEWETRTNEVLARHGGEFPDDWLEKVILRGFLTLQAAGW